MRVDVVNFVAGLHRGDHRFASSSTMLTSAGAHCRLRQPVTQMHCAYTRCPVKLSSPRHAVSRLARVSASSGIAAPQAPAPAIGLSDKALTHLQKLRSQSGSDQLLLRIGVKSGGCSGMSYMMDFEQESNVKEGEDSIIDYDGQFRLVCDSKSLLYLFGMQLDYSDALIGGGFQFQNPNAQDTCGCGKSFGV